MNRYNMKEMKAIWRRRLGLLRQDCGCTVTTDDYTDMDLLLEDRIRSWYAGLLQTADISMVPVEEMKNEIPEVTQPAQDILVVQLPFRGVRLASVQAEDWEVPVSEFYDPCSYEGRLQTHLYTRASWRMPIAVKHPRSVVLYGLKPAREPLDWEIVGADESQDDEYAEAGIEIGDGPISVVTPPIEKIKSLMMVAPPADRDIFILDASLLDTIPTEL